MTARLHRVRPSLAIASEGRRVLAPVGVLLASATVVATIALVDPNEAGNYPTCPWLAVTGTFCPGCGSLRAIHALAHADPAMAMSRNPLAVITVVWLAVWFVLWARRTILGRVQMTMAPAWVLHGILWIVLGYWVLRNIPGWTFLSPA